MPANLGTAYVQVRGDLSSLNKQLVANFHPSRLGKLGKGAGVAIGAGLAAGLGGAAAGKALFDIGKQFDDQFDKIRVGTGKTGRNLKGLESDFKAVFKSLPVSMEDAGTAVTTLNQRLGITGRPLQKLSRQILTLSRITKTDVGENVAAVTRLFGDWSVSTEDQSKQLNKMFRLTQRTGIGLGDLSRLMVKFGSPLRSLGFDMDEAAAMFGRFEKEGVNLQTTLPGFKIALKNFAKPTDELGAKFKKFGVDASEPREAIKRIFELLKSLPKGEATALAFDVFGSRAATDMFRAVKEGRFEFDDLIRSMNTGTDSINKAGRETEDFSEKWRRLKNTILVGIEPVASRFFDSISRDMDRVGKILSDPKLSTEEKWDRIGDVLGARLESGIEIAAETAGRLAPKVATAFLKGFINAPPLVQLVAGAWVFAKGRKLLAAFGLLGTQAGAAFGTGVGAGAAGGAAGGAAAGGLAGLATKLAPFVRKAGFIGLGLVAADTILEGLGARLDKASPDLEKRIKGMVDQEGLRKKIAGIATLGAAKIDIPVVGKLENLVSTEEGRNAERLNSILEQVRDSRRGITAEAAREATQLAHNLNLTRQQRTEIQRVLDAGRQKRAGFQVFDIAGIQAQAEKLGKITPDIINRFSEQLDDLPRKTRPKFAQAVLDWATELKRTGKIKGSLQGLKNVIEAEVDGVGSLSIKGPKRLKTRLAAGFESMVKAVADPTSRMAQIVATYLEAFGSGPEGIGKIQGAIARDKATRAKGHRGGLARGGFAGMLSGYSKTDDRTIAVRGGEGVLRPEDHIPEVNAAMSVSKSLGVSRFGSVQEMFQKTGARVSGRGKRFAQGGIVGRFAKGGIVPIPGQPGESIHQSILNDVLALIKRYRLRVTDGYAPSGHAAAGEHPKGLAIDVEPGAGGSWDLIDKLAKWAEPSQGAPRAPFRWVGYTGDSGHGRGNHLHLSWGGGGGGGVADIPDLGRIRIKGRGGVTKDLAQAAADKVRNAAQSFLREQAGDVPVGTSRDPGGGGSAANKRLARSLMKGIFPASEFRALEQLWQGESGWDENAVNPSSGAGGIPQALPASKMGAGWQGNARQQILWGLRYIKDRYGSPSSALAAWKSRSPHWYSQGGFIEQMFGGGMVGAAKADDKKAKKPKGLKTPPKGGPRPGKGYDWDAKAHKWTKRRRKRGDGFQLKQLDFLDAALERTIPGIQERIANIETSFDLAEPEHYPDERTVSRLQREGHNIQKIGDSFVDWSAVDQSKSFLGQILGESFRLIGTPFGAARGVMEIVKDAFPSLDASVTGIVKRLTNEINEIRQQVRENLREMRKQQKEIDSLNEKLQKERDRKKPDKGKLKRWNEEKDRRQDRLKDLRRENRRLTGESEPTGDLSGIDKGRLGDVQTQKVAADEALVKLKEDQRAFVGSSGVGGDFGSAKGEISRRVKDMGALTTERITEAIAPIAPTDVEKNEDIKNFLASLSDLKVKFGRNFQSFAGFQRGGIIPGFGDGDKVSVLAEPGEGFINKRAVSALGGSQAIERINRIVPRFQTGGVVQPISSTGPGVISPAESRRIETALKKAERERPAKVVLHEYNGPVTQVKEKDAHVWAVDAARQLETQF